MKLKILSFFAGAGFLDLGFEENDFEIQLVNEIHKPFLEAYQHSRKILGLKGPKFGYSNESIDNFLSYERQEWLSSLVKNLKTDSLVGMIGGPPCPDFSVGGKNKGKDGEHGKLSKSYIELICQTQPSFFLFENVKGLWRTKRHREFYDELKHQLSSAGYELHEKLVNAINYGAPQDRERILLFGIHKDELISSPTMFDWESNAITKGNAISQYAWPKTNPFSENSKFLPQQSIPEFLTVQHWFTKNDVENHPNAQHCFKPKAGLIKFQTIAEGDDSKKSYKRLHRWRYSPTAAYGNNEVHLHPYKARRISASEALSIQSLPEKFELPPKMTLTNMFKCIGNGVPFLLSESIAKTIKEFIQENAKNHCQSDSSGYRTTA